MEIQKGRHFSQVDAGVRGLSDKPRSILNVLTGCQGHSHNEDETLTWPVRVMFFCSLSCAVNVNSRM